MNMVAARVALVLLDDMMSLVPIALAGPPQRKKGEIERIRRRWLGQAVLERGATRRMGGWC